MDHADLAFAGLARHAELIAAGEITSRELTELFLSRIARLDPLLNAYRVVLGAEALAEADAADARRSGPLNGVAISSGTCVLPMITAPAARRRATTSESAGRGCGSASQP